MGTSLCVYELNHWFQWNLLSVLKKYFTVFGHYKNLQRPWQLIVCVCGCLFQTIEIPSMKVTKKVKSIQMFRKPVEKITQVRIVYTLKSVYLCPTAVETDSGLQCEFDILLGTKGQIWLLSLTRRPCWNIQALNISESCDLSILLCPSSTCCRKSVWATFANILNLIITFHLKQISKNANLSDLFSIVWPYPIYIFQGDRAGVCVTQFDPKSLERGTVCSPGALPSIEAAVVLVKRIPYYKVSACTYYQLPNLTVYCMIDSLLIKCLFTLCMFEYINLFNL